MVNRLMPEVCLSRYLGEQDPLRELLGVGTFELPHPPEERGLQGLHQEVVVPWK